ncbi:pseudouridine synthase [Ectobacillus panaciterrae]|uniref:pseudouridine synthase n=1 Tax=Ectobacillus panaciterrae TaxID=363872 RepID=UPI000416ED0B|nr:pseudouridine synthase [Ectobacillus panaciterrae]
MRIQKHISLTGTYPRREIERLIKNNRVTINGDHAHKNSIVEPGDTILIDGKPLEKHETDPVYIALHKPVGITCTAQKSIEGNIIDFMNYPERIFPVGRLDKASEGLILLTNNGDIVNKILRGEHNHEKEYIVTVDKPFTDDFVNKMSAGVAILDTVTKPCKVSRVSETVFRIILTQGLNRQIRRMCRALGYTVVRLQRVRIMNVELAGLGVGEWRHLTNEELTELMGLLNEDK